MQNDLTRETKFPVSSRPAICTPTVGLNLGKRVRSGRRARELRRCRRRCHRRCSRQSVKLKRTLERGIRLLQMGCESLAVSRECQFDFGRNGGRPCRKIVKYTTNAMGAMNPTSRLMVGPVSFEWFLQEGMRKHLLRIHLLRCTNTRRILCYDTHIFEQWFLRLFSLNCCRFGGLIESSCFVLLLYQLI